MEATGNRPQSLMTTYQDPLLKSGAIQGDTDEGPIITCLKTLSGISTKLKSHGILADPVTVTGCGHKVSKAALEYFNALHNHAGKETEFKCPYPDCVQVYVGSTKDEEYEGALETEFDKHSEEFGMTYKEYVQRVGEYFSGKTEELTHPSSDRKKGENTAPTPSKYCLTPAPFTLKKPNIIGFACSVIFLAILAQYFFNWNMKP